MLKSSLKDHVLFSVKRNISEAGLSLTAYENVCPKKKLPKN